MPSVAEIARFMEEMAPCALAEEWDNVGVLVDCGSEVSSVLVALDITLEVVAEADQRQCHMIISHHPVIFSPLRQLTHKDVVYKLVRKNITALCAHTNLDTAAGGVNDILAALFGLVNVGTFGGGGRIGRLRTPCTGAELAALCCGRLKTTVRLADAGRTIHTLAVLGGAGGSYVPEAVALGADCVLTGDADHHDALDALQAGVSLLAAGHFATEYPVVPVVADRLIKRFPNLRVHISRTGKDPFTNVGPAKGQ